MRNGEYRHLTLLLVFLGIVTFLTPAYAQIMNPMGCGCPMDCMADPLTSLPMCITNHYNMGDIDNEGILRSLLSKAQKAITLEDQGNANATFNILNSFINELQAQKGKHVTESGANMLIYHANVSISQLI